MTTNSRSLANLQVELPAAISTPSSPFMKKMQAVVWSPLLLLAAMIHVLCLRSTRRLLLAVAVLDIPLQWGIHLDFHPALSTLGAIGGYDCSITTIALCGLYAGWLFTASATSRPMQTLWNWPIAAYTGIVIASIFVASDPQLSLFYVFILLQILLLYIYLTGNMNSRSDIVFILTLIMIGGLFESFYMIAFGLIGHRLGLDPASGKGSVLFSFFGLKTDIFMPIKGVPFTRQGGTVGSPNYAAGYLGLLITLAICIRRMKVPAYLRKMTIPAIILGAFALALTFSRGGWMEIALSIAILVCARALRNGISRKTIISFMAASVAVVLFLYIPNPVSIRIFSNDNGSAESRIPLMHLAGNMIEAHPLLGVGANNFSAVMQQYTDNEFRYAWIYTVHNQFLLVCSETGVIGLVAYLWIYFDILRRGWGLWKSRDRLFAPLGLAIVSGVCGLMLHMLGDIFSERAILQLLWVYIALMTVCEVIHRKELLEEQAVPQSIEVVLS